MKAISSSPQYLAMGLVFSTKAARKSTPTTGGVKKPHKYKPEHRLSRRGVPSIEQILFSFFFFFSAEPGTEHLVWNRGVPAGIRPDFPELAGILTGTKTSPFCPGFCIGTGRSGRNGTGSISLVRTTN